MQEVDGEVHVSINACTNEYLRCTKCEMHNRVRKHAIRCTKKRVPRFLILEALTISPWKLVIIICLLTLCKKKKNNNNNTGVSLAQIYEYDCVLANHKSFMFSRLWITKWLNKLNINQKQKRDGWCYLFLKRSYMVFLQ